MFDLLYVKNGKFNQSNHPTKINIISNTLSRAFCIHYFLYTYRNISLTLTPLKFISMKIEFINNFLYNKKYDKRIFKLTFSQNKNTKI